jgi:Ca2+-binding EF-hand superfamily protein
MEALTFLVNNLGSHHEHQKEGASSSEGSGSDSGRIGSDGPNAFLKDLDFKQLREAFRSLDTENLGMLSMAEVKQAFKDANIPSEDVDRIFRTLDTNGDGLINYSEFLAATIDRNKALTMQNLQFAFHHFDVDGSGYITEQDLTEVFHREGKFGAKGDLTTERKMIHAIMQEAAKELGPASVGKEGLKISFEQFTKIMTMQQQSLHH